jgi:1-deoxy-D-xylulose-5-phosphate synthase
MVSLGVEDTTDYSLCKNKVEIKGSKVAIFAIGVLVFMAKEIANKVKEEINFDITVINPLFLNSLDEDLLNRFIRLKLKK